MTGGPQRNEGAETDDEGAGGRRIDHAAPPINKLPALVWLLLFAIAGIEAVLWLGAQGLIGGPQALGWRLEAITRWGYSGAVQVVMLENRHFPVAYLVRYGAFSFIHGGPLHAFFVIVLLAALGKYVTEAFGTLRTLAVLVPATLGGAVIFGLVLGEHELAWLFGGMPMVFALVGAATWWRWHDAEDSAGRWRAFGLVGALLGARLAIGLMVEAGHGWIAELAAFALGFALAALFAPGGWAFLRARLRQRG
ncbi:MAG: rhomboid family intramembrane serine protease [Pararhodobacter sp.]|nr:rhomboid family intramembrane serine protease [Pararhodobacter sp.]